MLLLLALALTPAAVALRPCNMRHRTTRVALPLSQPGSPCNTHMSLSRTLASDVVAGAIATAVSAPLVCTMDRAMTLNAAGRTPLVTALKDDLMQIARRPLDFMTSTPFLWIWFAYGITYVVANVLSTLGMPVLPQLLVTTIINSVACVAKDARFAQLYGKNPGDKRALPRSSYACFLARDIATMAFVFTLPSLISKRIPGLPELACRFTTPLLCQYFTTPLYLLGLALYNLPSAPWHKQLRAVTKAYPATVATRQVRAICQYSLTSVTNTRLRVLLAGC